MASAKRKSRQPQQPVIPQEKLVPVRRALNTTWDCIKYDMHQLCDQCGENMGVGDLEAAADYVTTYASKDDIQVWNSLTPDQQIAITEQWAKEQAPYYC